jgi:hypothetical protein
VAGSGSLVEWEQANARGSLRVEFWGEEFREFIGVGQRQEKMGEGVAQGVGDDHLGERGVDVGCAQPTSEEAPDSVVMEDGQVLEESLDDETDLDVACVGGDFAPNLRAVAVGLVMEVLIAVAAAEGPHGFHPEVLGIGADGVNGLLETDFDFEPPAVKLEDGQRIEGEVGAQKNEASTRGVIDQDETGQPTQRPPEQVQ